MESVVLPVLLFALCAGLLAVGVLAVGQMFGPRRSSRVKEMPYESGMDPIHDTRRRFDVRFYLVAIAFLVFDVELLFLYPWAVASRDPAGIEAVYEVQAEELGLTDGMSEDQAAAATRQHVTKSRLLIFGEVMVFISLLAVGLTYAWRKGVFRWR